MLPTLAHAENTSAFRSRGLSVSHDERYLSKTERYTLQLRKNDRIYDCNGEATCG